MNRIPFLSYQQEIKWVFRASFVLPFMAFKMMVAHNGYLYKILGLTPPPPSLNIGVSKKKVLVTGVVLFKYVFYFIYLYNDFRFF